MLIHPLWTDGYRLLLMQLYLRKPVGMKAMYSKAMVSLSLELHIPPAVLYEQMFMLRNRKMPSIARLWDRYGENTSRLARDVKKLRSLTGFCNAAEFYSGVETSESFEKDFRIIDNDTELTPVMLIMILDLYFRLTPVTMVEGTPEVAELARMMKIKPGRVVEVMEVFRVCDPYLSRGELIVTHLLLPCRQIWNRFGNGDPSRLSATAAQLKEFFV